MAESEIAEISLVEIEEAIESSKLFVVEIKNSAKAVNSIINNIASLLEINIYKLPVDENENTVRSPELMQRNAILVKSSVEFVMKLKATTDTYKNMVQDFQNIQNTIPFTYPPSEPPKHLIMSKIKDAEINAIVMDMEPDELSDYYLFLSNKKYYQAWTELDKKATTKLLQLWKSKLTVDQITDIALTDVTHIVEKLKERSVRDTHFSNDSIQLRKMHEKLQVIQSQISSILIITNVRK